MKLRKSFSLLKDNADRVYIHGIHSFPEVAIGEREGKIPFYLLLSLLFWKLLTEYPYGY